jgi:carboxymethylenebutenolidase
MGEWLTIAMDDGYELPVWHVAAKGERRGGLVLVQEIFGVTEHIRELCAEYAADGYEVLSPGLFDREEPGCALAYAGADWDRAVQIARNEHPFEQSLSDTQRCIGSLAKQGGPVFILGYCYGGSVAWRLAQIDDRLAGASAYYGGFIAARFADDAPRCATIAKQHPTAQIFVYEAGHGFNSDRRKDYHRASAVLAKERTLMLFKACGG